jgi:hypothetical protein
MDEPIFCKAPPVAPAVVLKEYNYESCHKTAIVVGVSQGGTSMIAAVIDALGISMGEESRFNFEGRGRPSVGDQFDEWVSITKECDASMELWGTKDTMIWRFPADCLHTVLRNPYYLAVSRDSAAVLQRRGVSLDTLKEVLSHQEAMWNWLIDLPEAPLLLVSYERSLRDRKHLCEIVADFLNLAPSEEEIEKAVDRIAVGGGYLVSDTEAIWQSYKT